MTATCPPPLVQPMSHACGMHDWQVLRSPTTRRNIRYSVRQVAASKMLLAAAQLIASITNTDSSGTTTNMRLIVYIQNKARCNAVEHVLSLICPDVQCLLYHADLSQVQRSKALQLWKEDYATKPRLMVATSAFGCGIDVPSVRCVVHLGLPTSVIDFVQESGRAGRDGCMAHSVIFHTPLSSTAAAVHTAHSQSPDTNDFGAPSALCNTPKTSCRRWFLDMFVDGAVDKRSCHSRQLEPCDLCQLQLRAAASPPSSPPPPPPPSPADEGRETKRQNRGIDQEHRNGGTTTEFVSGNHALAAGTGPATPAQLRDIAERLNATCPPCSTATKHLVRHTTQSVQCFNNICLRCCGTGHKASLCPNLTLPANTIGCYTCTLNKINGIVVHNVGTYGKRSCQLKLVFGYCIAMWESDELCTLIRQRIPCTAQMQTTEEFVHWLRCGTATNHQLGILHMVPVLQSIFFD